MRDRWGGGRWGGGRQRGGVCYCSMIVVHLYAAGADYMSLDLVSSITSTPDLMCFQITLSEDSSIENRERFDVQLTSVASVIVDRAQSMVFIDDTTSMSL